MNEKLYRKLKRAGFSPAKAREIVLDVARGDAYAIAFLAAMRIKT